MDEFDLTWRASWPGSLLWESKASDVSKSRRNDKKYVNLSLIKYLYNQLCKKTSRQESG